LPSAGGNLPQAIGCYLEAGESEGIPDLVAALGEEAVLHGRWQELSSWLEEALTLEQIRAIPGSPCCRRWWR